MWVIQNQNLMRLPDDVPVPLGSVQVEVADDFLAHPEAYIVEANRVVKRPETELKKLYQKQEAVKLTQEEIARLKKAVAEGRL